MTIRFCDEVMCLIYGLKEKPVPVYFSAKDLTEIGVLSAEREDLCNKLEILNEKYRKATHVKVFLYDHTDSYIHAEEAGATSGCGVDIHNALREYYMNKLQNIDEKLEAYGVKVRVA